MNCPGALVFPDPEIPKIDTILELLSISVDPDVSFKILKAAVNKSVFL